MFKRMFTSEPAQIRFTEDYHEQTRGCVLPGKPIYIEFADERFREEPSGEAQILLCVQFDRGPTQHLLLRLRSGWRNINPARTESGEGNLWCGTFTPPQEAREMSLWFVKTAPSGRQYYDSKLGANYWFRFTSLDVKLTNATVGDAGLWLQVEAQPDLTSVSARYRILNGKLEPGLLQLQMLGVAEGGTNKWEGNMRVDARAVVSLDIVYTVSGRTFQDDNQRRHYTVPDPDAVLAARRAEQAPVRPNG